MAKLSNADRAQIVLLATQRTTRDARRSMRRKGGLTEERYHDKIELSKEFVEARKRRKIKPGVNAEKQDGHYPDTSRYKGGKSRFTAD